MGKNKKSRKKKKRSSGRKGGSTGNVNSSGMLGRFRGGMQTAARGESSRVNFWFTVLLWVAVFVAVFVLLRRYGVI